MGAHGHMIRARAFILRHYAEKRRMGEIPLQAMMSVQELIEHGLLAVTSEQKADQEWMRAYAKRYLNIIYQHTTQRPGKSIYYWQHGRLTP